MRTLISYLLLLASFSHANAVPDPAVNYRVLHTPHFEIIFDEKQRELAKRYALAAEQAYELLMPIFKEGPDVTPIFLSDNNDGSNGLASFLPYPLITVFPVLPGTLDSIDDYGDWPLEMIVHEYTHILNMYPAHGAYTPFKYIFGSVLRPNAVLPKWYLEGLAVNLESRLTDHGRLRVVETFATARALSLGHGFEKEDIAKINEQDLGTWPYGNRPYLFGGWWWRDVQSAYGEKTIEAWNQSFSRRFPFLLNGPMRGQTGKKAVDLLTASYEKLNGEAERELEILGRNTPHTSTPVVDDGTNGDQRIFALSPSGNQLIYLQSHPHIPGNPVRGTEVKIKSRASSGQPFGPIEAQPAFKTTGTTRVHWMNEKQVVFDQVEVDNPYHKFRDLFVYDFTTKTKTRLTSDLRATEPAPSPLADKIAFVKSDGGRNDLGVLEISGLKAGKISYPVHSNFQQRISGPEFINNNEIIFAMRERNGAEKLWVHSLATGKTSLWENSALKSAQNPRLTAKGVLVSDEQSGVRNVYLVPNGRGITRTVSNTLTHIETADLDPQLNELIFAELTPKGTRLMSTPLADFHPSKVETPKLEAPPTVKTSTVATDESSYQPFHYLLPHYWIPFVYQVEGGLLFQGSTANSDPAGRNLYTLNASYDTVTTKPSYGISYLNTSLPVNIGADYYKSVTYLTSLNRTIEGQNAALSFNDPMWPFHSTESQIVGTALWSEINGRVLTYHRYGPAVGIRHDRMESPLNTWGGYLLEAEHREYIAQSGYTGYGRTILHTAVTMPVFGESKIFAQARAAFAPRMPSYAILDLGDRSLGANYMVNLTNSDFLMRGYPSAQFVGRKILNGNFEYSLPAWELAKGAGTFPIFLRSLQAVIFTDAMAVDGAAWRTDKGDKNGYFASSLNRYFVGTGAELRLSATAAYHMPFSLVLGGYYGFSKEYGGGLSPFIGFGYGDLGTLAKKTP